MHPGRRVPASRIDWAMQNRSNSNQDIRDNIDHRRRSQNPRSELDADMRDTPDASDYHSEKRSPNTDTDRRGKEVGVKKQNERHLKMRHSSPSKGLNSTTNHLSDSKYEESEKRAIARRGDKKLTVGRSNRARAGTAAPSVSTLRYCHDNAISERGAWGSQTQLQRASTAPGLVSDHPQNRQSPESIGGTKKAENSDSGRCTVEEKYSTSGKPSPKNSISGKLVRKGSKAQEVLSSWVKGATGRSNKPKGRSTQGQARSSSLQDLRVPRSEENQGGTHLYVPHDDRNQNKQQGRYVVSGDGSGGDGQSSAAGTGQAGDTNTDINGNGINSRDGVGPESLGSRRRSPRIPHGIRAKIKRSLSSNAMSNLAVFSEASLDSDTDLNAGATTFRSIYKKKEVEYMDTPHAPHTENTAGINNIKTNPLKKEVAAYKTHATARFGADIVAVNRHYMVLHVEEFEDSLGTQSGAFRMGLSWGDKVVSLNGHPIRGIHNVQQTLESTRHITLETYGQPWIMLYKGLVCPERGVVGLSFKGRRVTQVDKTRGAYWTGVCVGYALLSVNDRCVLGLPDDVIDGIMTRMCARYTKLDLMFMKDHVWEKMNRRVSRHLHAKRLDTSVAAYVGASLRLDRRLKDTENIEVVEIEELKPGTRKRGVLAAVGSKKKLS
ncbi:hypothetical protein SARC_13618 [Sphaeroforma arctica JP610]|uniref:PDZ domain-containing protein n=1 Tax=Sphaeroforma arctica JP610 TaxID=667725 RepID=A0A0L0FCM8_9EUKA|nr:hypothetical protein SARC_13618 [Sphaeroforma arctica JP610]KNC73823.1 hypothetical protein SARC_13618 [Sphaeroforma arctica JP610]|eukprot:XP_014147725.1 hypothetical protein SARC_13618 [Sphaeroforma arctica JP610]